MSRYSRCWQVSPVSSASSVMPMMPFIGVRISWLMLARNSLLARVAASAAARRAGLPVRPCDARRPRPGARRWPAPAHRSAPGPASPARRAPGGALLGALLVVDVGAGAEPLDDPPRLVEQWQAASEVPAVGPIRVAPQAVLDLERRAGRPGLSPDFAGPFSIVRVDHAEPTQSEPAFGVLARVIIPAAVDVLVLSVGPAGPDELGQGLGQCAEPRLAGPQLLLAPAALGDLALECGVGPFQRGGPLPDPPLQLVVCPADASSARRRSMNRPICRPRVAIRSRSGRSISSSERVKKDMTPTTPVSQAIGKPKVPRSPARAARVARGKLPSRVMSAIQTGCPEDQIWPGSPMPGANVNWRDPTAQSRSCSRGDHQSNADRRIPASRSTSQYSPHSQPRVSPIAPRI